MDFSSILGFSVRLLFFYISSAWLGYAQSAQTEDARAPAEFAWFKSDKDIVEGFSDNHTECVGSQNTSAVKLGRLAFNSPRLLGGQAARMKLSCASCHPSGRSNQRFFIEQISSVPGTADISHSFLSSAGGDGVFNSKVIPDLANRSASQRSDRHSDDFSKFMHRLIEVEFDGQKPSQAVFDALLTYLQSTDQLHCKSNDTVSGLQQRLTLLLEALELVRDMIHSQASDEELRFVVLSTRSQLGNLYEVYGLTPNSRLDRILLKLSHGLDMIVRKKDVKSRSRQLRKITRGVPRLIQLLEQHEVVSAFNLDALTTYLDADKTKDR